MTEEQLNILNSTSHPQAVAKELPASVAVECLRELQIIYSQTKYSSSIALAIKAIEKQYPKEFDKKLNISINMVTPRPSDKWRGYFRGVNVFHKAKRKKYEKK